MTTKYSEDHEYVRAEGANGTIGISAYAQEQLGDIVFVELPAVGNSYKKGDEIAVVESVKAASEIYAPVACTVTEINETLNGDPGLINSDPMGEGWLVKISIDNTAGLDSLMDEAAYKTYIA